MSMNIVRQDTDEARRDGLALTAICETEALLRMLDVAKDHDGFDLVLRGVRARLLELNSVCMSVLGNDDARETEELASVIYGASALPA